MVEYREGTAFVPVEGDFDLAATFACGQAFRWKPNGAGVYIGCAGSHWARIARTEVGIAITPCDDALYEGFWRHYMDLDRDYGAIAARLRRHEPMRCVVDSCGGMRILNQPIWECLVSFILSSNNNVARISGIVERLCWRFGEDVGGGFHAFPDAERLLRLGEPGIRACGAGYRAEYVVQAAEAVAGGFSLDELPRLGYEKAKGELMRLKGVGEKVADCVLLFSCGYREAFPVDVWVSRCVPVYFPDAGLTARELRAFAAKRFGDLAGIVQQYIFHYERVVKAGRQC